MKINFLEKNGFTLLEVVIACAILVSVLGVTVSYYMVAKDSFDIGSAIVTAQNRLLIKLEEFTNELMETSESNLTIYSWTDNVMGKQDAICFSSARDQQNNFIVQNGQPIWQAVVVYAPYFNPNSRRGEIRRYIQYGKFNFPLTIRQIDATRIVLRDGTTFLRNSGKVFLGGVARFDAQALKITALNPISVRMTVRVNAPKGPPVDISLQTSVNCRN